MNSEAVPAADTHEVLNQPDPLKPFHAWRSDLCLREAVTRESGGWSAPMLEAYGAAAGGALFAAGFLPAATDRKPGQLQAGGLAGFQQSCLRHPGAVRHVLRDPAPAAARRDTEQELAASLA